jgi:hypothetical protein
MALKSALKDALTIWFVNLFDYFTWSLHSTSSFYENRLTAHDKILAKHWQPIRSFETDPVSHRGRGPDYTSSKTLTVCEKKSEIQTSVMIRKQAPLITQSTPNVANQITKFVSRKTGKLYAGR